MFKLKKCVMYWGIKPYILVCVMEHATITKNIRTFTSLISGYNVYRLSIFCSGRNNPIHQVLSLQPLVGVFDWGILDFGNCNNDCGAPKRSLIEI
jgi:hypothetical protein